MSIQATSSASTAATSAWQTRRQDFGNLVSAIKSGNLADAQQAFATLAALGAPAGTATTGSSATGASAGTSGSPSSSTAGNGPLGAVGQALQNGDIAGAQKALAQAFAGHGGGHHHHHHGGGASAASSTAAAASPGVATATAGTIVNTLA